MNLKKLFRNFIYLFYPKLCINCSCSLMEKEDFLCLECYQKLPKTHYFSVQYNLAYYQLAEKIPIVKAASYLYYKKDGLGQKIVTDIKYRNNILLGKWISRLMTIEGMTSNFFEDFDIIIPVPLHKKKKRQRGFNQAEIIARTISELTGIDLNTHSLYRKKANPTQTKKGVYERWQNTSGIFGLKDKDSLEGKHILLIDDVLTTGATLEACAHTLLQNQSIRVSMLTLSIA